MARQPIPVQYRRRETPLGSARLERMTVPRLPEPLQSAELRLASGLVLALFVLCHFLNHALGLVSLDAMEAARPILSGPWRTKPGAVLLYGALGLHFALTLRVLYRRRTLRMSAKEAGQTALGLLMPFLLVGHVVGTRVEFAFSGHEPTYPGVVNGLWVVSPGNGAQQALALVIVWAHAVIGLYFWLRPKPFFPRYRQALFTAAVMIPVFSLLGFAQAGKELSDLPREVVRPPPGRPEWIDPALRAALALPIALVFAGRGVRAVRARRNRIRLSYPGGRVVVVPRGFTVLEASRQDRVPHQAVCGGKARCSTCRVAVLRGSPHDPPPGEAEAATLKRIGAPANVRLACQFRPVADVEVVPLLSQAPTGTPFPTEPPPASTLGRERTIAVLFCDLRGFTSFAERSLPFDVVFILNRYFETVGTAVTASGGFVDKFIGDGAMVLFGLDAAPQDAARQAIEAADRIRTGLLEMNAAYEAELRGPLRFVIAVHIGPAIVGEIGFGTARGLTAVGDTINVASRLEGFAKAENAEIVLSDDVVRLAGRDLAGFENRTLSIRGRSQPLKIWVMSEDGRGGQAVASGPELPDKST